MSEYYKRVELGEGNLVQFVGVYVLRWQQEWGEPTVGFAQDEGEVDALRKQLAEEHEYYARVVNEQCAPDELHCTCVPALRNEIDTLRKKLKELLIATEVFIAFIRQSKYEKANLQMLVVETLLAEIKRSEDNNANPI